MTTPLIEVCARALNPRAWDDDYWAQVGAEAEQESAQQTARRRARAVIHLVLDAALEVLREPVLGQCVRVNIPPHRSDSPVQWAERVRYHAVAALKPEAQS